MGAIWGYWLISLLDMLAHSLIVSKKFPKYKFDLKTVVLIILFPASALILSVHKLPITPVNAIVKMIFFLMFFICFRSFFLKLFNFIRQNTRLKNISIYHSL
jgi:hypothetical protein